MADTFKVFLVGYARSRDFSYPCYGKEVMDSIAARLKVLFDEVCGESSGYSSSDVTWQKGAPSDTDLVAYVFYSKGDSIIDSLDGEIVHDSASGGTLAHGDGTISEVYFEPIDGAANFVKVAANIIFHELMHNKLDAGNPGAMADIHSGGGGGLAAPTVSAGSVLTAENKKHMAKGLSLKIPQYTKKMRSPRH